MIHLNQTLILVSTLLNVLVSLSDRDYRHLSRISSGICVALSREEEAARNKGLNELSSGSVISKLYLATVIDRDISERERHEVTRGKETMETMKKLGNV